MNRIPVFDHHLAELAHNQESDDPGDAVAQQYSRTRHLNRRANAKKQTSTNCATQRNQLNMTVM